jgi:SAM-dependent methyltransferase
MIKLAHRHNPAPDRCHFEVNRSAHLHRFATGSFDLVYSRIVLQHVPPRLARGYITELYRVLAPGGALVFQLPGRIGVDSHEVFVNAPVEGGALKRHLPTPLVRLWRELKYRLIVPPGREMAMYGVERDEVVALLDSCGATIVDIKEDYAHGTEPPGWEYWIRKG